MQNTSATRTQDGPLAIVSDLKDHLIRARINEQEAGERLNRAIRDSERCGVSIDSLSEASGYEPSKIRHISGSQECAGDLAAIAGIG